ncbi:MAG: tRNA (adenosine(37)-N6)-threonylcarbamoyltransferase complex dimerization subunit type 1 TsaB [Planctomycetaceae bacterium]
MLTLGIETSGSSGTVALCDDGTILQEIELSRDGRRHARTLIAELKSLCQTQGVSPQQIQTVAVSVGPGSFTGLRVGIVCARTFAYATGCQLVGIDTLTAIAAAAIGDQEHPPVAGQHLEAVINAFRGELFVGSFRCSPTGDWVPDAPTRIVTLTEFLETRLPTTYLTGPGVETLQSKLPPGAPKPFTTLPECLWHPRASTIATLGESAVRRGDLADLWSLPPNYLRRSAAEEKADIR